MVDFSSMKKFWASPVIEFYTHETLFDIIPKPRVSQKFLPDWFKGLSTTYNDPNNKRDQFGNKLMTAKKCMPLLDVMSLGYIIPLAGDLHVKSNQDCSTIEVTNPPGIPLAEFHDVRQVGEQSAPGFPANPIKFINHWVVRTAPGWSAMFVTPFNHLNQNFTCLSGMVDTDKYPKIVNFPAIWHTPNFDGTLKAGTPLVQVIPIKRSDLKKPHKIRTTTAKDQADINKIDLAQKIVSGYYTDDLRVKK